MAKGLTRRERYNVPDWWQGSIPEWFVYKTLLMLGYKDRFSYQHPVGGGRLARGGTVIDFFIPELNLAIMVQSVRYHYANFEQKANDTIIRAMLVSKGYRVIFIDEEDVMGNPGYIVEQALGGVDLSRVAFG